VVKVIDTSTIVKWFVEEGDSALAVAYIGEPLVAPELMLAEIGNAMWKKWRKGEIPIEQAQLATAFVTSFVEILSGEHVAEEAMKIALELNHPVYDCYFLATARELQTTLVTFDHRLKLACAGTNYEPLIEFQGGTR
jgi:predicted nucleic acid-binding protein